MSNPRFFGAMLALVFSACDAASPAFDTGGPAPGQLYSCQAPHGLRLRYGP
jgi:hypothetical protein